MELDKRSYTARQLYHLTPKELHHAHYRRLLGRPPVDWLVKSSKSWRALGRDLVKSTTAAIGRERARAGKIERKTRRLAGNIRGVRGSSALRNQGKSIQDIPRLNFPSAEVQEDLGTHHFETAAAQAHAHAGDAGSAAPGAGGDSCGDSCGNSSCDSSCDSPCDSSAAPSLHDSDEEFFHSLDANAPPSQASSPSTHGLRHYAKRIIKTDKRMFHRERGEILFVQQFLVQVRETRGRGRLKELNSIPPSTVKERSTEYTAVARFTGRPETPVAVYLYDTEQISHKIDHRWSRALKHKLYIDANTQATLFNTLDLSVAVWNYHKRRKEDGERVFFLFMSQSILVQVSWLYFILHSAGRLPDYNVNVKIPELHVSVILGENSIDKETLRVEEDAQSIRYTELIRPEASPSPFVRELHRRLIAVINKSPNFDSSGKKFIMSWRNIDFIRTILVETNFHATSSHALLRQHTLEIRSVYALTTAEEPPAIEGFCWRLSTWRGLSRKQKIVTRTYFHTHNHLLFHVQPSKMILPDVGQGDEMAHNLREFFAAMPCNSEIDPYPLNKDGQIKWCVESTDPQVGKFHDTRAVYELARNSSNIEASDGFIDMTTIVSVRPLSNELMFEVVIAGGSSPNDTTSAILIRVADPESRTAWIDSLCKLVMYWREKKKQLHQDAVKTYEANFAQNTNFMLRSNTESNFAYPNVSSFNIETSSRTRPIVYSNYLYEKSHKHGFFRKFYAVLTSSSIILYTCESDSKYNIKSTETNADVHFNLYAVYDLLKAYVYSGEVAHEYLSREAEDAFDFAQMYNGVPRMYDSNWMIQDREADCCFGLWTQSHKQRSKNRQGSYEARLLCMARSRIERDLWVNALQSVTTALSMVRDGTAGPSDAELSKGSDPA